jgi:SAM-dependent methyltransferase
MTSFSDELACPSCTAASHFRLKRVVDIYHCSHCGLDFADSPEEVIETPSYFFEGHFDTFERDCVAAITIVEARLKYYENLLGRPLESILEVGCGTAAMAPTWNRLGIKYLGVEFIESVAAEARNRTRSEIVVGDFTRIEFDQKFDVVIASQVFEHIGQPAKFLIKLREVAELVHLDVPNQDSLISQIRKKIHKRDFGFLQPPHHLRAYSPASLRHALEANGFAVILCQAFRNDDQTFGQILIQSTILNKILYFTSHLIGRGSLLVAIARSPGPKDS